MKTAVVILNWNGKHFLEKYLPSVVRHSQGSEIWIADNASTDESLEFVSKTFPSIRILRMEKNHGFAKGYNVALQEIESEIFVLLNSDVEVTGGWLTEPVNVLDSNPSVAAVQGKIMDERKRDSFEYAGAAGGLIDKYGFAFCRGRLFSTIEKDRGQYEKPAEIFWASGAALFVRAGLFRRAGGFEESFFAHMEEIDLCWRFKSAGYEIWYEPKSVVFHVGGGSLPYGNTRKVFLNFRNNLYMLFRNLPAKEFRKRIVWRLFMDWLAALRLLLSLKGRSCFAVLAAHRAFFSSIKNLRKQRKEAKRRADENRIGPPNMNGMYMGSLVFQYYARSVREAASIKNR